MKRMSKGFFAVLVLTAVMIGSAWAVETTEEKNLNEQATQINKTAAGSQGEKVVVGRFEKEFNVTDAQIQSLRNQKMGYGEISIVFSLASKMPGGVTDANIQQIMTMRQGSPKTGWGEVCNKLGIKLGPTVSQMRAMNKEMHGEMMRGAKTDKGTGEKFQDGNTDRHGAMSDHEGMSGGEGMSHGKSR